MATYTYTCKRCQKVYKVLGQAFNHLERKHPPISPPELCDNLKRS